MQELVNMIVMVGMVSLCAGCDLYEPWAALIVGSWGGLAFNTLHHLMVSLHLDDPLDAVAVHGGGGLVGLLAVPVFMVVGLEPGERGLLWDGDLAHPWLVLAHQLAGALVITVWAVLWATVIFGLLSLTNLLRVSRVDEVRGMDLTKHGEAAYPVTAWLEHQYTRDTGETGVDLPVNMNQLSMEADNDNKAYTDL